MIGCMYYVYELQDASGTTFYVGKGSGRRMYQHKYRAKHGEQTPRADKIRELLANGESINVVVVFETTDEAKAYAEEIRRISLHGRSALTNRTDGGCGIKNVSREAREKIAKGRRGHRASEITRQRQREAKLGKPRSQETKEKISAYQLGSKHPWAERQARKNLELGITFEGRTHSPETLERMRAAKLGHIVTEETRQKISNAKKGTTPWNKGKEHTTG